MTLTCNCPERRKPLFPMKVNASPRAWRAANRKTGMVTCLRCGAEWQSFFDYTDNLLDVDPSEMERAA